MQLNQKEQLPWHKNAWQLLAAYMQSHRVPQALLITGGEGLGKFFLAQQFAQALVCQHRQANSLACFKCPSCRLVAAETHPDFITILPNELGKAININQIRSLFNQLCLKPQFEFYRVVIINPSELMSQAAANALLKCLEEPPERTVIILIAENKASLSATIRSRCQQLLITNPDTELSQQWLNSQNIKDDSEVLLNLASGAPLLAYRYANLDLINQRNDCFKQWITLILPLGVQEPPVQIAEQWCKLESKQLLVWLVSWVMDIIKIHILDSPKTLNNSDFTKHLKECAQRLKLEQLFQFYDLLLLSQQRLQTQLSKQLIYEQLLLEWSTYIQSD